MPTVSNVKDGIDGLAFREKKTWITLKSTDAQNQILKNTIQGLINNSLKKLLNIDMKSRMVECRNFVFPRFRRYRCRCVCVPTINITVATGTVSFTVWKNLNTPSETSQRSQPVLFGDVPYTWVMNWWPILLPLSTSLVTVGYLL